MEVKLEKHPVRKDCLLVDSLPSEPSSSSGLSSFSGTETLLLTFFGEKGLDGAY